MRWLMVDRFTEIVRDRYACAIRNVTLGEDHIHDHFPGYPTWPRSLLIEGLAQTGGILVGLSKGFREMIILAKVDRMTFYDIVVPGDQIRFRAELEEIRDEGARIKGEITVDDRKIADGAMMFVYLKRENSPLVGDGNLVFAESYLALLGVQQAQLETSSSGDKDH